MSKSPYSDLQGKTLEEIIVDPSLWSKYMDLASRDNDLAISLPRLLSELQNIEGPIARAREAHVMIGLNRPFREIEDLLTPFLNYPLCEAMYLMAVLCQHTEEAYYFVARQPEFVTPFRTTPSAREAQLRWDFARGQGLERNRNPQEAIRLLSVAHRAAIDLEVDSIAGFSQVKLNTLSINTPEMRISTMLAQLEQAQKAGDIRVVDSTYYNLCMQYAQIGDYESLLEIAQKIAPYPAQKHLVQGSRLLLGLPLSEDLPSLEGSEGDAFSVMTHVLADFLKFKQHIDGLRNRRSLESLAKKVLSYTIAIDTDMPIAAVIATCLQALTYSMSGHLKTAVSVLNHARHIIRSTEGMPEYARCYVDLVEADVKYKSGGDIFPFLETNLVEDLDKHKSFQKFVLMTCPYFVYMLNREKPTKTTEHLMEKVLRVTKDGFFMGKNQLNGMPKMESIKQTMEYWHEGDPMDQAELQIVSRYARRLENIEFEGIVVEWWLDTSVGLELKWEEKI